MCVCVRVCVEGGGGGGGGGEQFLNSHGVNIAQSHLLHALQKLGKGCMSVCPSVHPLLVYLDLRMTVTCLLLGIQHTSVAHAFMHWLTGPMP